MDNKNLKHDLTKVKYILTIVITLLSAFVILSLFVILPVYLLSEKAPNLYSLITLSIFGLLVIFLILKRYKNLYQQYRSTKYFTLHILIHHIRTIANVLLFLFLELLVFRFFYYTFNFFIATSFAVLSQVIIILFFTGQRILMYKVKDYLKSQKIKT